MRVRRQQHQIREPRPARPLLEPGQPLRRRDTTSILLALYCHQIFPVNKAVVSEGLEPKRGGVRQSPQVLTMFKAPHLYEVRPRKDRRGFDLISDALPFGRLWDGEPNAIGNAVAQRNQITRKLAISKFANWILCFCHIRLLAMGRFN